MALWHLRSRKKPTGGRLRRLKKKRRSERGDFFMESHIGDRKFKTKRTRGGGRKVKLTSVEKINVTNPKTGKITRTKVLSVTENPTNPHYVRRNILTRGAVVKTELGLAKITSKPGQHGVMNAKLVEEKKSS